MNPLLSAITRYVRRLHFTRRNTHTRYRMARKQRLLLEALERRDVPSTLSVTDVTVREGPTSTGILDTAGAASVGISGIRDIAFVNGPSDPHFGDLFVTGFKSYSVARFDWA